MRKRLCLLLVLLLLSQLAAGCFTATGRKSAEPHIRYAVGAEPQTLDPRKMTGLPEAIIAAQISEGLTTLDSHGSPLPAAAERWSISADGLVYTFNLRPAARWSNGDRVTARDFAYAWTTALSPELASEYAYQLFYIKNGEAYSKGLAAADTLGIKVLDDHTLEVTLEHPTAYFLSLLAFHTYYPVHAATAAANPKWAAEGKTIVGNGPFTITGWQHNSSIDFGPNKFYWDAAKVRISRLEFILTESSATELALFDNNQLDMGGNPPSSEIPRLLKEKVLTITPYAGTYFIAFNVTNPPFDNLLVRKAFSLAIDRGSIIRNITRGQQRVALAWVPYGLPDAAQDSDFRQTGGSYLTDNDGAAARQFLAEAGYPEGRGLPPVTLIYNTNEMHKAIAEALQEMWKKNLGVQVSLANQEWKVFLDNRHKGYFQMARHGWIGDYADPMTFIDVFMSDSGNNDAQYRNPAYDQLVKTAKGSSNPVVRMEAMHAAERLLLDEAVLAPIYFYTKLLLVKPHVKGFVQTSLGIVYFKEAYVETRR